MQGGAEEGVGHGMLICGYARLETKGTSLDLKEGSVDLVSPDIDKIRLNGINIIHRFNQLKNKKKNNRYCV